MPDLSLELAEAFEDEGFLFSCRWHTFTRDNCQNGCHAVKDEDGFWCHVPTLPELVEFVEGSAKLDALTLLYAHRALLKLRNMPPEKHPRRRKRKAAEVIRFPQKRDQDEA
jgi:hypothetical protein